MVIVNEIKAGERYYSTTFKKNVDVARVFKTTATIRVCGGGLCEGELMTFRGERLDTLEPRREIADWGK